MSYSFQAFAVGQVLTAAQMDQVEANIRDHVHGAASVSGDVPNTAATQANQETGTSLVTIVTPGRQQFHASAAKGWVLANYAGGAVASYNVTSITDTGTGKIGVTWATDFSGANYACVAVIDTTSFISARIQNGTSTAGTIEVDSFTTTTGADADGTQVHVVAFGDQ